MFEDDIDAFFLGDLACLGGPGILAVIDDMISAKFETFFDLVVGADGCDHRAADFLGKLDRG